jgi:flagellar biosynthesis/type III secretory pathway ATPase
MGAYRSGTDREIDSAIAHHPAVMAYIQQSAEEQIGLDIAVGELTAVFGEG